VNRAALLALAALLAAPHAATGQATVGVLGEALYVQHRVDAGSGLELSSGTLVGARAVGAWGRYLEFSVAGATGALTADSGQADDADLARGEVALTVLPVPFLGIRLGAEQHTFSTPFAVQRWTAARVGGEGRLRFSGGRVTGMLRFEFFPAVSVSGLERPNRAFGAASGIAFRSGVLTASLVYQLDRYDFPEVGGVARREHLSLLTGSIGLAIGRGTP
jgi:hypothetical protein